MIDRKYKLKFTDSNVHDSVSYILVSKFNIKPNVHQARIDGSGGRMILSMVGSDSAVDAAIEYLRSIDISVELMENFVKRDDRRCIDCGSCISVCPTFAFELNKKTWEVMLDTNKCISCGSCLSACPTHAITLKMNP